MDLVLYLMNPIFFQNLFLTLSMLQATYIIGGDFTCTLVPTKDRSTNLDSTHIQTRKILLQSCKDLNFVEIWRKLHPDETEYSCYSSKYEAHLCIYYLVSFGLLTKIEECCYISDHAGVLLNLHIAKFSHSSRRWTFPVELKQDTVYKFC